MMARPNILILISDQLAQRAIGAYGNRSGATPTIDALAAHGVRFENAYSNCPLCTPSRASFWSGRLPHQTGIVANGRQYPNPSFPAHIPTLGELFAAAGYQTVHFGKTGDAGALRGFQHIKPVSTRIPADPAFPLNDDTFKDVSATSQCADWLRQPAGEPFLCVADLNNPHNICGWVGANEGIEERLPVPEPLPELLDNFEVEDFSRLPRSVQYICCAHRRMMQAAHWTPRKYRQYLAAYCHYVRLMDGHMAQILGALHSTAAGRHTLIVFLSDHGDAMGAHRMITKHTSFQEECVRVPFIFAGHGVTGRGTAPGAPLVSLVDLLPTLCDLAGMEAPSDLPGISLAPCLRGELLPEPHPHVVSEWHTEWGFTIEPGRMLRTPRFKYTRYLEDNGEELYDLTADPGERRNLSHDAGHQPELEHHRALLEQHLKESGDPFLSMHPKTDARWRAHPVGYPHHTGPCAPMVDPDAKE
jgi:choline-sulfatase